MTPKSVVIAGLGDSGLLTAIKLAGKAPDVHVVGISTARRLRWERWKLPPGAAKALARHELRDRTGTGRTCRRDSFRGQHDARMTPIS